MDAKLKTGIIIMIIIIVLIFLVSIICPNVHRYSITKVKKVEDEEVPFQKPAAPEQEEAKEELKVQKLESFCLSKPVTETSV